MTTSDKEYFEARFNGLDKKVDSAVGETRAALEAKIDSRFNELRAELHKTTADTVKWCAGIVATALLLYTTLVAFLMNNAMPRATQTTAAPAPTVIVVPQASSDQQFPGHPPTGR
ncbi:hypothetical protein [Massilia eburnea]|uniref:hypothetical protein n=1 Tax=Massilia eburnea TaxID=1776165 RepID=UPI003D6B7310